MTYKVKSKNSLLDRLLKNGSALKLDIPELKQSSNKLI